MPKLSLAKLERHLYSAADRLRQEGLDAATYRDYIFGMLFLKRRSAVFDAERENIVGRKIEQGMVKEAAALLLEARSGQRFDALVTGASEKGTWVRVLEPPVEGKVVQGFEGFDVGDRVRVKLIEVNVERGFIDFVGVF